MDLLKRTSGIGTGFIFIALIIMSGQAIGIASAADAYYEGYIGDVIDLHGVSYSGTQVFLFFTGPGLPENGVTLSDTSQRADQGHFTIVDLDNSGQWSLKWDTRRLKSQIDPGTYTVYVTTEPADLAHLGGTNSYKTLEVYLQDTNTPQGESGPGTYTLSPEKHISSPMQTIVMGTTKTVPSPASIKSLQISPTTVETTSTINPELTPTPTTTQAGITAGLPLLAVVFSVCMFFLRSRT
jgi:hypothetical protein